jgi:hypothetical protein
MMMGGRSTNNIADSIVPSNFENTLATAWTDHLRPTHALVCTHNQNTVAHPAASLSE